jgi:hypothetical protein
MNINYYSNEHSTGQTPNDIISLTLGLQLVFLKNNLEHDQSWSCTAMFL